MPSRREVWQSSFPEAKQIATGAVRVRGCGHFRGYRDMATISSEVIGPLGSSRCTR